MGVLSSVDRRIRPAARRAGTAALAAVVLAVGLLAVPTPARAAAPTGRGYLAEQATPTDLSGTVAQVVPGVDGDTWLTTSDGQIRRIDADGREHAFPATNLSWQAARPAVTADGTAWTGEGDEVVAAHRDGALTSTVQPGVHQGTLGVTTDGAVWQIGGNTLNRMDPDGSGIDQTLTIPRPVASVRWTGVLTAAVAGDRFWIVGNSIDGASHYVGSVTEDGTTTWWPIDARSSTQALSGRSDGTAWMTVDTGPDGALVRLDADGPTTVTTSKGWTPTVIAVTDAGTVWVGEHTTTTSPESMRLLRHGADGSTTTVPLPSTGGGDTQYLEVGADHRVWVQTGFYYGLEDGTTSTIVARPGQVVAASDDGALESYTARTFTAGITHVGSQVELVETDGTVVSVAAVASTQRIAGSDRYTTSVALAKQAYPTSARVVIVATGANYPDALAAGPVAAHLGGPLLLTAPGALPGAVAAEIRSLAPARIVIAGGPGAVSATVEQQLSTIARAVPGGSTDVVRIGAGNRFATASALDRFAFGSASSAWIATGTNFPDALAASAAAGAADQPVVLVDGQGAPADALAAIRAVGASSVTIAGGPAAVSATIAATLGSRLGSAHVVRAAGADRFATAAAIAGVGFPRGADTAFVSTGTQFPDALAGAAVAASEGGPMLTSAPECAPVSMLRELRVLGVQRVEFVGGASALTDDASALRSCH